MRRASRRFLPLLHFISDLKGLSWDRFMQITNNTTDMIAELTVPTDKDGRDHCVVVVKGTFSIGQDGKATLAKNQEPFVYADVHYGDPGTTSIKYECDFASFKPKTDVIVNGHAYSPTGKP